MLKFTVLLICAFAVQTGAAHAYIDPNAGGMLFQLLMPLFATIAGAWLLFRKWLAAHFTRLWRGLTGVNKRDRTGNG